MSLVWVMWFIFWLISLCKISCLFVCLFALGLLKKSCLINLQTQDLFPTRPPAIAIGNTFSIVLLFFHAILVTIPSYKSVFPTHLLEERKVDFSFISKGGKISYFLLYSIYLSFLSSFIPHILYVHDSYHYDSPFLVLY